MEYISKPEEISIEVYNKCFWRDQKHVNIFCLRSSLVSLFISTVVGYLMPKLPL